MKLVKNYLPLVLLLVAPSINILGTLTFFWRWNAAVLQKKADVSAGWSDWIPAPISDSSFPYKKLREGRGRDTKFHHKTQLLIYLFVIPLQLSVMPRWKKPAGCNKSTGHSADGGTAQQIPACYKEWVQSELCGMEEMPLWLLLKW